MLHGRILAMDNLHWCKMIIAMLALSAFSAEESVDHLLLNCMVAHEILKSILRGFECSQVLP